MSEYKLQYNIYSGSSLSDTGHMNISLFKDGQHITTVGATTRIDFIPLQKNVDRGLISDGIVKVEERPEGDFAPTIKKDVLLSQTEYNAVYNYLSKTTNGFSANSGLTYDYQVMSCSCAVFTDYVHKNVLNRLGTIRDLLSDAEYAAVGGPIKIALGAGEALRTVSKNGALCGFDNPDGPKGTVIGGSSLNYQSLSLGNGETQETWTDASGQQRLILTKASDGSIKSGKYTELDGDTNTLGLTGNSQTYTKRDNTGNLELVQTRDASGEWVNVAAYNNDGTGGYKTLTFDSNNTSTYDWITREYTTPYSIAKQETHFDDATTQTDIYDPESGHLRARFAEGTNGEVVWSNLFDASGVVWASLSATNIGGVLGSSIGAVLGGNDLGKSIAASTLIGAFGRSMGTLINGTLGESFRGGEADLGLALDNAAGSLGINLVAGLRGQLIGQASSLLMAELADELGLSGFERGLVMSMGGTITTQMLSNIANLATNTPTSTGAAPSLFNGFDPVGLTSSLASSVGGYFGSYLAARTILPDNPQAQIGTSIGAGIGAFVGSTMNMVIPGLGSFIGSYVGTMLGTVIGNAFGVDAKSNGAVLVSNGDFYGGQYQAWNKGDPYLFKPITTSQADTLDAIFDLMEATPYGVTGDEQMMKAANDNIQALQYVHAA